MNKIAVANTIDEVLGQLDAVIAESTRENSPASIFAYVYRRTTAQIKQAIQDKEFNDNEGMEKFDVHFANKYLEAYYQFKENKPCSAPWAVAFETGPYKLTILQHIILGMNAHINYDLGITGYEMAPSDNIEGIKSDFMSVNQILNSLTNEMQSRLSRVSRLMFLLDWIGKNSDEEIINFSMVKAREQAWNLSQSLYSADEAGRKTIMSNVSSLVANLGLAVKHPKSKFLSFVLKIISRFEEKDVKTILSKLEND